MDWQKLDRAKTTEILDRISQSPDGKLFSITTSEAVAKPLPFYNGFMRIRLTNYATLPSFSLDFLSDGSSFYLLDGSPDPIEKVNQRGALTLNRENVARYIGFFFKYVATEDGDAYLIRDPDKLPFLDSLSLDQQLHLRRRHTPPEIEFDRASDCYVVQADLYYAGTLLKGTITVDSEGHIDVLPQAMLMGNEKRPGADTPTSDLH